MRVARGNAAQNGSRRQPTSLISLPPKAFWLLCRPHTAQFAQRDRCRVSLGDGNRIGLRGSALSGTPIVASKKRILDGICHAKDLRTSE